MDVAILIFYILTSDVICPILIKIPRANNIPPTTKSNVAKPMALQGTSGNKISNAILVIYSTYSASLLFQTVHQ